MDHLVAPSFLAADFARVKEQVELVNSSAADWLHLDVMDGVFVPNISFGFPVIKAIHKYSEIPLDVHVMIVDPDPYIEQCKEAGAASLTVHYEACTHLHRTVQKIKQTDMQAGVALNPHTPVHMLKEIITELDLVLIMSVNPGYGGQSFITSSLDKIARLRELIDQKQAHAKIEVDGGVNLENAGPLLKAGADVLVAGSTVFKSDEPVQTIRSLKKAHPKKVV